MFNKLTVKQLKALIKHFKDHHTIKNYSRMKKQQLITELENRFEINNGVLYLKNEIPDVPVTKTATKKTTQPTIVPNNIAGTIVQPNDEGLTAGQKTYKNTINAIESKALNKEKYQKDSAFAKRLRGNK
jgi:hypothetical protein